MKKVFSLITAALLSTTLIKAQAPDWQVTDNTFTETMTLITVLQVQGQILMDPNDIVAAFVGDQVRGVASPSVMNDQSGNMMVFLVIQGEADADDITFKIFDASAGVITDGVTKVTFVPDGQLGDSADPVIVTENYLPTDISLSENAVSENLPAGTVVGSLLVSDDDIDELHSFILTPGGTDNGLFQIVDGELVSVVEFDFEAKDSYSVEVEVTDDDQATFVKSLTVSIVNVNDAPSAVVASSTTFFENEAIGTLVAELVASDDDSLDTHTYTLVSGTGDTYNGRFRIEDSNLISTGFFDAEVDGDVSIRVRASDGELSVDQVLSFTVASVNEAPTISDTTFLVVDGSTAGTVVGRVLASDQDADQDITFKIVYENSTEQSNSPFSLDALSGELTLRKRLVFDRSSGYFLNVEVSDNAVPSLSATAVVSIELDEVISKSLQANNYISANNDGVNDFFFIENIGLYSNYELLIIDEYGSIVVQQSPYENDWDGRNNSGNLLPSGVYYYKFSAQGEPFTFKGSITLFRE